MHNASRVFYKFLGINSLLIGLFPFFIPVYLYKLNYSLNAISSYIALTATGFVLFLWLWDRLHKKISLFNIFVITFVLEIVMMGVVFLKPSSLFLILFGLSNGAYSCFFWTTQRAIFYETIDHNTSGRKYGNFQIFVSAVLQVGILIGGVLLEKSGLAYIYLLSLLLVCFGILMFYNREKPLNLPTELTRASALSLHDIINYRDKYYTRTVFILDGLFLFLESYFWLISLFLIAHESFSELGIIVIILSLIFFVIFLILKNTIDRLSTTLVYTAATLLYAASWMLRGAVTNDMHLIWLFIILIIITFCTSFFRLTFNKRFYDLAKITNAHRYLILKSYYSQFFMIAIYTGLGLLFTLFPDPLQALNTIYLFAALLALIYLVYGGSFYRNLDSK